MNNQLGVYKTTKGNGDIYYRSSITFSNKHISLGSFSNEKDANLCYKEAKDLLYSTVAISELQNQKLPFQKAVSLINFRDNKLYFSTPIYIRNKIIYYYFSLYDFYLFDIEDMFYYGNHTITRRGNHLFVAEYGMQVNILNRYGIKNYGVKDKDYHFKNGNERDFRYENIDIVNRYFGVEKVKKNKKDCFRVKIHIRSSYIVGYYETEIIASIAYNKAVDILKSNGFTKNYKTNFLEELSGYEYATIYSNIKIAPRIYELTPDSPL